MDYLGTSGMFMRMLRSEEVDGLVDIRVDVGWLGICCVGFMCVGVVVWV